MSTTTRAPESSPGSGRDKRPAPTGPLEDLRRFLDDGAEDLPGPEARLGEIAVSRGYISEAQLEEGLEEQRVTTPHVLLGEILLRRRFISGEHLLRALAAQKKPEPSPQIPEGARIGKYALVREIGRGGMGVVFEAEDPDLRRRVAVKVLREGMSDPAAAERMRREAAIVARLRHPGIVSVHEVGTTRPRSGPPLPFFAMDYIEGRTLAQILEEGRAERADLLRILEEVAGAVAHAHAAGIVHRDLKPANVIVDTSGRAMLSDFGIARATAFQTRITETSFVVGTPEYMAPEQIEDKGQGTGPSVDIHALGVILYEILTGTLPYRADSPVTLMRKILSEDPVSPRKRDPGIPRDLETLCLKALEKEPGRRYRTAEEFGADLARFRAGRPISVRPTGLMAKLWRKGLRHKPTLLAVGVAASAMLSVVAALGVWARRERREAIAQLEQRMEALLRAALEFRRAGDIERMKGFAAEARSVCDAASKSYPSLPEPHALAGRMHRALMDRDRALEEQNLALRLDPECLRALYERIVLTFGMLGRREDELVERAWRGLGERLIQEGARKVRAEEVAVPARDRLAQEDARARELRDCMTADLRRIESLPGSSLGAAERICARGLASRSSAELRSALAKDPHLEEAVDALAVLEAEAGHLDRAIEVWSAGLDYDKGCLTHLEGRGEARLRRGHELDLRGEDPAPILIAAIGDFSQALDQDPKRDGAMRNRGLAHFLLGYSIGWTRLEDATRQFQSAAEDLGHALDLNPSAGQTWMWRGVVRAALSVSSLLHLEDPTPRCREALADLSTALERAPQSDEPYFWRACARIPWSVWLALKGQDAEPLYRASLEDMGQALRLNPGRGETWLGRASLHLAWAKYQAARGQDGVGVLRQAALDLDVAIEKIPGGIQAPARRGEVELALAAAPGEDALARCRSARACFETVLARNPRSVAGISGRGEARMREAAQLARAGQNPEAAFESSFRDLDEAVKRDPAARTLRAEAHVHRGEWNQASGRPADPDYQAALADAKSALEANLFATEAWIWHGRAQTLTAGFRPAPMLHYAEAIGDFDKVLFFTPDLLPALRFRADAYRRRATLKSARSMDPGADLRAALADYTHVLRIRPGLERELAADIAACRQGLDSPRR